MPWTHNTQVTAADVDAWEAMLDVIEEQDRQTRLRAAYQLEPSDYNRVMYEGWDHADASKQPLALHHD